VETKQNWCGVHWFWWSYQLALITQHTWSF